MLLSELIKAIKPLAVYGEQNFTVSSLTNNSKEVKAGGIFVCISGYKQNGHLYVNEAIKKGALAVITEHPLPVAITQIIVKNSREAQALVSKIFYDSPSSKLKLIGITGTNGKTTTSYLTEAILRAANYKTGLMSTINYKIGDTTTSAKHTTPDSIELGKLLEKMVQQKVDAAVMEVSSHALELERVTGCDFFVTVFSNITRDHFEFHHNFPNYLRAKSKLFANQCNWSGKAPNCHHAVINIDDPASSSLIEAAQAGNIWTYGINQPSFVQAISYQLKSDSSIFTVKIKDQYYKFSLKIPGIFSIYNALAAITTALVFDIEISVIQEAIANFAGVPGRCEYIDCGQDFKVMVDFAHNPSGLYSVLATVPYPNSIHKKIVVFGCEGGRDPGKRSLMGNIAAKHADYCIITTDNVYQEEPLSIAQDIEQGVILGGMDSSQYKIILDRYEAIQHAIEITQPGDTVIIAGKGHEANQVIHDKIIPFDDRVMVKTLLEGDRFNGQTAFVNNAAYH